MTAESQTFDEAGGTNITVTLPNHVVGLVKVTLTGGSSSDGNPGTIISGEISPTLFGPYPDQFIALMIALDSVTNVGGEGFTGGGGGFAGGAGGSTAICGPFGYIYMEAGGASSGSAGSGAALATDGGAGGGGYSGAAGTAGLTLIPGGGGGGSQGGYGGGGFGPTQAGGQGDGSDLFGRLGQGGGNANGTTGGTGGPGGGNVVLGCGSWFTSPEVESPLFGGRENAGIKAVFNYVVADAPAAPALSSPPAGSTVDSAGAGVTFQGIHESTGPDTGVLEAVALSLKIGSAATGYWNGTDFTSAVPVWLIPTTGAGVIAGKPFSLTVPAGVIPDGVSTVWAMATQEALAGLEGPFAATQSLFTAVAPVPTIVSPVGPVADSTPAVSWTSVLPAGASQVSYRWLAYTAPTDFPGFGTPAYDSGVVTSAATSFNVPTALLSGQDYFGYLQIISTNLNDSAWVEADFQVQVVELATPVLTVNVVNEPTTGMPAPQLAQVSNDNLLTANDSTFEGTGAGSVGSFVAGASTTISASTTHAEDAAFALKLARTSGSGTMLANSGFYSAVAGTRYWFMASSIGGNFARVVTVSVEWFNGATPISTVTIATGSDSTSAWTQYANNLVAPAGTTQFQIIFSVAAAAAANDGHFFDEVGVFLASPSAWTLGGVANTEYQANYGNGWQDVLMESAVPVLNNASTSYDFYATFNAQVLYRARNTSTSGGQTFYSAWSNIVTIPGVQSSYMWVVPPSNPALAMRLRRLPAGSGSSSGSFTPTSPAMPGGATPSIVIDELEELGVFRTFGKGTATLVHGDLWDDEFDLNLYFDSTAEWEQFKEIRELQDVVLVKSDMEGATYWVTMGPDFAGGILSEGGRHLDPKRGLTIHCTPTDAPS